MQDPHQCITFWNRGAETLYGWTAAEAIGQNVATLLGATQDAAPEVAATDGNHHWQGEVSHCTKDGQRVTVLSRQTRIASEVGGAASTLVVNTDITEKKQREAAC